MSRQSYVAAAIFHPPINEVRMSTEKKSASTERKSSTDKFKEIFKVDNSEISLDGPAPKWKVWYARSMLVWAVLSQIFLLLQVIKIYTEKDAAGVSLAAYAVYIFGTVVWFVYGAFVLAHKNWALIINALIGFISR